MNVDWVVASGSGSFESVTVESVLVGVALTQAILAVLVLDCVISYESILCSSMTPAVPGTLVSEVLAGD